MRELVTVATAFILVVGLALFMFIGNKEHTTAVMETKDLKELVEKNQEELKQEISSIKLHIEETDSIFHNRKSE
jgi:hypothetical protein